MKNRSNEKAVIILKCYNLNVLIENNIDLELNDLKLLQNNSNRVQIKT